MPAQPKGWRERLRGPLLALSLLGATGLFAGVVGSHYPLREWLFWRYLGYVALSLSWGVGCLAAGHVTIVRILRRPLPVVEQLALAFAVGLFEFYFGMNLAGLAHAFHAWFFPVLPVAMLGLGGPSLWRYLRRLRGHLAHAAPRRSGLSWVGLLALSFGALSLGLIYFSILTPENVQFDARWKHLGLAEEYAVTGHIRRFGEGWTVATYPHLATLVYTWAFLLPGGRLFDRVELAAHMEFTAFLFGLVSISALASRLLPRLSATFGGRVSRPRAPWAWVVRFLFPGVFLYDSSLSGGGDHLAAVFAAPIFLLVLRAEVALCPRFLALFAMMLAGGGLVKYTGLLLLVPFPAALLGWRALRQLHAWRRGTLDTEGRRNLWLGPLTLLAAGLFFTAPHWVKNWVWYQDPLYPLLYKAMPSDVWTPDAADMFQFGYGKQFWRPSRDWSGFLETLRALGTFSFVPNDYRSYHGEVPVFGSLFTLLLVPLLLLPGTKKRLWQLYAYVHCALFLWYWTHHQDRYLQALAPLMTAATAAILCRLWYASAEAWATRGVRAATGALVALQGIWGLDVYFLPGHAMIKSPPKAVIDLIGAGHRRDYDKRLAVFGHWASVGRALGPGARAVLHENHAHLGLGAETINDSPGWQYGLSYGRTQSPAELYDRLRELGATHLVWEAGKSSGWDSLAGDLMFLDFALRRTSGTRKVGNTSIAPLPSKRPPMEFSDNVALLGCGKTYKSGLYKVSDLTVPTFGPRSGVFPKPREVGAPSDLVSKASFVVLDPKCQPNLPGPEAQAFTLGARRGVPKGVSGVRPAVALELWLRRSESVAAPDAEADPSPGEGEPEDPSP